jgi:hypothetical protein
MSGPLRQPERVETPPGRVPVFRRAVSPSPRKRGEERRAQTFPVNSKSLASTDASRQQPGDVPCWRKSDRDTSHLLQRLDIDHRDVIGMFIGHVGRLVVGRDRQPAAALPAQRDTAQELQVRQRVGVEGTVQPAVDQ